MSVELAAARERLGYDAAWDAAGVIDDAVLLAQATTLATGSHVHAEHYRWAMWRRHLAGARGGPVSDAVLEALLLLDTHEATRAGPGFGHGIVLDIAAELVLTDAQRARIAAHAVHAGLSSKTRARLLEKLAAPARR